MTYSKIELDSKNISKDDFVSFHTFLTDLRIDDLLIINKMVIDETNTRINDMFVNRQ